MRKVLKITAIALTAVVITGVCVVVGYQFIGKTTTESRDTIPSKAATPAPPATNSPILGEKPLPAPAEPSGTFEGLLAHSASGRATLVTGGDGIYIRLEDDFSVTNGPDLYVYVGTFEKPLTTIAALKGNKGGQNYKLPEGVGADSFNTVWIYCKAFATPFAKAKLAS